MRIPPPPRGGERRGEGASKAAVTPSPNLSPKQGRGSKRRVPVPDQALVNSDLQSALVEARQAYVDRNPKSFARQQEAVQAMPGGNTRTTLHNSPFPLTVVPGERCGLGDADGHEYIDLLGEYTAGIYGHSHPVMRAAVDK